MVYYFKKKNRYYKKYKNGKIVKIKKSDVMKKMKGGNIDTFKNLKNLIADAEEYYKTNPEKLYEAVSMCNFMPKEGISIKNVRQSLINRVEQGDAREDFFSTCSLMASYITGYFKKYCDVIENDLFEIENSDDFAHIIDSYKQDNILFRITIFNKKNKDNHVVNAIHDLVILKINMNEYIILQSFRNTYSLRDWLTDGDLTELYPWKPLGKKMNELSLNNMNANNEEETLTQPELSELKKTFSALNSSKDNYGKSQKLTQNKLNEFLSLIDDAIFRLKKKSADSAFGKRHINFSPWRATVQPWVFNNCQKNKKKNNSQ